MAVDAVIAGVEFSADEPLPERGMAGVQCGMPILIPVQHFGVLAIALREILFAKAFQDAGIVQVGLGNEARRRPNVLFFLPVNGNLRFAELLFLGARLLRGGLLDVGLWHGGNSLRKWGSKLDPIGQPPGACCKRARRTILPDGRIFGEVSVRSRSIQGRGAESAVWAKQGLES